MKLFKIALLFLFFSPSINAQYLEYYNLTNKANKNRFEKNYKQSLKLFQTAFEKVEYVHASNYVKAAFAATKLKQYDLVEKYLTNAMKASYPAGLVNGKAFKGFRKSKNYSSFKDKIEQLEKESDTRINGMYKRKIDSLHYIDQNLIRGNDKVQGLKLDPNAAYSDSSNFACLLQLIDEYGFPSEQEIGFEGYRKSWVIIHHSARLIENHSYHSKLLEYVKSGEYLPENYCWVIDQGQELLKQNLIYYHWDVAKNIDLLTEKEKDAIDLKRAEVGLASIRRIEVVSQSNTKQNKVRW